jgi:hypothetical protein
VRIPFAPRIPFVARVRRAKRGLCTTRGRCAALVLALAAGLAALAGCHRDASEANATQAAVKADPKARVQELIDALTPIKETVTSDIKDKQFIRAQELLAELRRGGTSVGHEALSRLHEKQPGQAAWPEDVERGLLDVAAHAAPAETQPLIEALITQYGATLGLRTQALMLASEIWPAETIKILEPIVADAHPGKTLPPAEFLVSAWVKACAKTGRSPVKELADVATNLFEDETGRIRAVKELGHFRDPLATQALSTILVESTGDAYLRRMAAQGLRDTLDRESACKIFETVAQREADTGMLEFLRDMLDKNCGNAPEKPAK